MEKNAGRKFIAGVVCGALAFGCLCLATGCSSDKAGESDVENSASSNVSKHLADSVKEQLEYAEKLAANGNVNENAEDGENEVASDGNANEAANGKEETAGEGAAVDGDAPDGDYKAWSENESFKDIPAVSLAMDKIRELAAQYEEAETTGDQELYFQPVK